MEMAHVAKTRSTCLRLRVGAATVKDRRLIATGYNDTPMGITNCGDGGCERCQSRHEGAIEAGQQKDRCICVHAEQNAILQAAYHGVSTKGATLYSTVAPCSSCAKMIINAGITRVVCEKAYSDTEGQNLLKAAGIATETLAVK
jgi:dCMP deaminase